MTSIKKKRLFDIKFLSTPEGIDMSGDETKFFLNVVGRSTRGYFDMQWDVRIIHYAWYNLTEQSPSMVQKWMESLVRRGFVSPYMVEGKTYAYITCQIEQDVDGFGYQYKENRDGAPVVPLPTNEGDSDSNGDERTGNPSRDRATEGGDAGRSTTVGKRSGSSRRSVGTAGTSHINEVQIHGAGEGSTDESFTSQPKSVGKSLRSKIKKRKTHDYITATALATPRTTTARREPVRRATDGHDLVRDAQGGDLPVDSGSRPTQHGRRSWKPWGKRGVQEAIRKLKERGWPQKPSRGSNNPYPTRTTQEAPKVAQRSNEGPSFTKQVETARAQIIQAKKNSTFELQSFVRFPQDVLVKVFAMGTGPLNRDELLGIKDLRLIGAASG